MIDWENNEEIQLFREYLRIPTVHPNVNYDECIEFLKRQAASLDLPVSMYYPGGPSKPILVMTWVGTHPDLPKIVLNSHMDVVPVFEEKWTYPPFGANIDSQGRIYARGSQDMKCVGMQYLAAIRLLKSEGIQLRRTVLLMYVPDEEIGGKLGIKIFVKTEDFKALNVGFSLDEGIASPDETYPIFYAERSIWYVHLKCNGTPGHGSLLLKNTAGEKVRYMIDKFMDFRATQVEKLKNNPELTIGDVTTVNLNILKGGVQDNVVPPHLTIVFDIRLDIHIDHAEFESMIKTWIEEAGGDIDLIFHQKNPFDEPTKIDETNIFWLGFKSATDELGLQIKPSIFPGGTDSRYIRREGIPAIGFSPMNNTPVLLHDNDEFLKADTFLNGIQIMKTIIKNLSNV